MASSTVKIGLPCSQSAQLELSNCLGGVTTSEGHWRASERGPASWRIIGDGPSYCTEPSRPSSRWFRISPHFTDEETEARGPVLLPLCPSANAQTGSQHWVAG